MSDQVEVEAQSNSFQCDICLKSYNQKCSLSRHIKLKHEADGNKENSSGTILCPEDCTERFITMDQLIIHLCSCHNKAIDLVHQQFTTLAEFMQWKEQYETSSRSSFVLHSSPKERSSAGYVTYYYYCSRSGKYIGRGKGKRQLKIQGSSKLNNTEPKKFFISCKEATSSK
ncbi:PREDICTED: uncharacterized protein LOC109593069, partial [Amphimedon queenslandica]|uniref:C2H2-type domain-containing protein n=1 Tax=Amphimedon queenslandica TaxID=400682 RepID=A0AAN0K3F5_AMPQE